MRKIIPMIIILLFAGRLLAQIEHPVKWSYAAKRSGTNETIVFSKADIESGWHIYSAYQQDGGPVKTSFEFTSSKNYSLVGGIDEPVPITKFEEAFNMKVRYFENAVIFQQKVDLKTSNPVVKGQLTFMVCNNQKCLPPETIEFAIPIK